MSIAHDHNDLGTLTFGCAGCIERVKIDQDVAAVMAGDFPTRPPLTEYQIMSVVNHWHPGPAHCPGDPMYLPQLLAWVEDWATKYRSGWSLGLDVAEWHWSSQWVDDDGRPVPA